MTLLTAQVIGGKKVGVDLSIPPKTVIETPFLVAENPAPEFADISSIINWYKFGIEGNYLKKDYLFIRDEIVLLVDAKAIDTCLGELNDPSTVTPNTGDLSEIPVGARYCVGENPIGDFANKQGAIAEWDGTTWIFLDKDVLGYSLCSLEEKEIAAQLYIGLINDHERDFEPIETRLWREEHHELATETRLKRMLAAESLIAQELPAYQGIVMLTITSLVTELNVTGTPQLYSIDLHKNYNYFGVRSSVLDFHPIKNPNPGVGIMDYFYGTSLFTDKGLINMPFTPVNRVC